MKNCGRLSLAGQAVHSDVTVDNVVSLVEPLQRVTTSKCRKLVDNLTVTSDAPTTSRRRAKTSVDLKAIEQRELTEPFLNPSAITSRPVPARFVVRRVYN